VAMDLAEKGFSQLDISDDIILPTVVTVLQSLAKFHAISAAYISKVGLIQLQKEFPHVDGAIYNNDNIFQEVNKDLKEFSQFVRRVPGFYTQHLKFEEWRSSAWDVLTNPDDVMMDRKENLVFTSMSRNHVSSPVVDIATFLFCSCDNEMREENLMKLLETYCFSFSENFKKFGVEQNIPTMKILNEEYERYKFEAFIKSILIMWRKIKFLQENFNNIEQSEISGSKLRILSGRALELLDEAYLCNWRPPSSFQVETSSLTLRIPAR